MQYNFLNVFLDKKELLRQEKNSLNQFLLENNALQLENIYDFYKNKKDILLVNGYTGSGKWSVVEHSFSFLSNETIILKYNCFDSTILDDILLFFFSEFKKITLQNLIIEPKSKSENFAQKINSYFSTVEKPFLIVFDSFESILKENRQEILDFISHLSSFSKIKIILISRSFDGEYLESLGISHQMITVSAFEKHLFEKFIKSKKIKVSNVLMEELFRHTRGYYFFTALSVKVLNKREISLEELLKEFKNSFLSFDEFLIKQVLELVPPAFRNLLWLIAMVRQPVGKDLLRALKLYDEACIEFLTDNLIVAQDNSLIYVQDYFKEQINSSVSQNIANRIRSFIIDLYKTQLPLKPLERNILISRQTMRKEIEYHTLFLPKKLRAVENPNVDVNYLAYTRGIEFDYGHLKMKEPAPSAEHKKDESEIKYVPVDLSAVKNISLNLNELPFLDPRKVDILGTRENVQAFDKQISKSSPKDVLQLPEEKEEAIYTLSELLEKAKGVEGEYLYPQAVEFYKKALLYKDDSTYQESLFVIYKGLANSYLKLSDYENAIKYYDLTKLLYEQSGDFVNANYVKLLISEVFCESFKFEKSREILLEIIKYDKNPPALEAKAYLQLANLDDNLSDIEGAFNNYKKAIDLSDSSGDLEVLSELYFKYALILDDKGFVKDAIEFYNKCISLGSEFGRNKFLSSAYSNIATLYFERSDFANAVKNHIKAYEIDKKSNNYDGMYYSSSKIASILQKKYPDEALKYFKIALASAEFTNDIFYIASASLAIGDFYSDRKKDEIALKYFAHVLDLVKNQFSKENTDKIKMRISDIKFRLGEERFEEVMRILREEK